MRRNFVSKTTSIFWSLIGLIISISLVAGVVWCIYTYKDDIVNTVKGWFITDKKEEDNTEDFSIDIQNTENVTYICTDTSGKTYTEEELKLKKWNGEELTFNISVNKNYYISSVKVNGETVELTENELTIEGVPAGVVYEFKVTCNKNITIEIETTQTKTYTVEFESDNWIYWQLTKNGDILRNGDTIQIGDVLGGRVISTMSGYRINSFLINDEEKVSLLDNFGRFEYKVENFESNKLQITGTSTKDTSSNVVQMTRDYNSTYAYINFEYTNVDYSVYYISNYGVYVGQEVKATFTLKNEDVMKFVKLDNEEIEYTVQDKEVTFTFVVPDKDFTISVQTEYMMPVQIAVNYDSEIFNLISYYGNIEEKILSIDRILPVELSLSFKNAENYVDENGDLLNYIIQISYGDVVQEYTSIYEMEHISIDDTIYEVKELNISLVKIN